MSNLPASGSDKYNQSVEAIYQSRLIAIAKKHDVITLEHVLASLLVTDDAIATLEGLNVDVDGLRAELDDFFETDLIPSTGAPVEPSPVVNSLIATTASIASAKPGSKNKVTPTDILLQLASLDIEDSHAVTILHKYGITPMAVARFRHNGKTNAGLSRHIMTEDEPAPAPAAPTSTESADTVLSQYTINLNKLAEDKGIDNLIGREKEVDKIAQILARRTKNNPLMIGEPGVGKTAIAEGLALKIVKGEVPDLLKNFVIYSLDFGALMAGTRYRGDFEERIKLLIKAFEFHPEAVLFIDEIHMLMGAGAAGQGNMDAVGLLKPALAKGKLRCFGSTTSVEFRKHFEKDTALLRRFSRLNVGEPTIDEAKDILRGLKSYYEDYHKVTYTDDALEAAVDLSVRYISGSLLPDKAIDLIDEAGAAQNVLKAGVERKSVIDLEAIEIEVAKKAVIPPKNVTESEADKLTRLEHDLRANVFGQDAAITVLSDAVFLVRAGLRENDKTAGAFLFTGPTGVGKTEAVKTIAATLNRPLLRFDMSEYMEKHTISKLIGAPPGYTGFSDGAGGSGLFSTGISEKPHAVVLLDEIEKAHPDIYNILLQIMDNGGFTDSGGKYIDCRNIMLIMTSNIGAKDRARAKIGFGNTDNIGADEAAMKTLFSPEFLNRLDETVRFDRLKKDGMLNIVDKFLTELKKLAMARDVVITVDDDTREWLAKHGYDPAYGARPLKRLIAQNISKPLSKEMLIGSLVNGGEAKVTIISDKVHVSV
jgi:ATP-dependent Clp protease ATP-binding subunit ClpA